MNYEEAMDEETEVSRVDAIRECEKHQLDPAEMLAELGDHPVYKARDVLIWFGH